MISIVLNAKKNRACPHNARQALFRLFAATVGGGDRAATNVLVGGEAYAPLPDLTGAV